MWKAESSNPGASGEFFPLKGSPELAKMRPVEESLILEMNINQFLSKSQVLSKAVSNPVLKKFKVMWAKISKLFCQDEIQSKIRKVSCQEKNSDKSQKSVHHQMTIVKSKQLCWKKYFSTATTKVSLPLSLSHTHTHTLTFRETQIR